MLKGEARWAPWRSGRVDRTVLKKVPSSKKEEVREVRAESQEEGRSPD